MTSKPNNYFVEKTPVQKMPTMEQTANKLVPSTAHGSIDPLEADKLPMPTLQ